MRGFRRLLRKYGLVILCCATLTSTLLLCFFSGNPISCDCQEKSWGNEENHNSRIFTGDRSTFLIVLVFSSANNLKERDTIRQTWLKQVESDNVQKDIIHYFAIGSGLLDKDQQKTLTSENQRFKDLLFLPNVNDSYSNLSLKLKSALVWFENNYDFKFILKVDDDSFVMLEPIMGELMSVKESRSLYWGFFDGKAAVKKRGPWKEKEWILCDYYLPYALGGGYVISKDLVQFVAVNEKVLKLYKSEDVSMGTWLAPLDVNRIHDPRFDTEYKSRGCLNSYLVTHKQSCEQMREKHWLLQEEGKLCTKQVQTMYPYVYDWNVLPSKCCKRNNSLVILGSNVGDIKKIQ